MEFLTFKYGSCEKDIVKMNCFNLPDLKERKIFVSKPEQIYAPAPAQPQAKEDNSLPTDVGGKKKVLETPPWCPAPKIDFKDKSTCWSRLTKTERRLVRVGVGALALAGTYFILDPFGDKGTEVVVEKPDNTFHPVDANPQGFVKTKGFAVSFHF